MDGDTGNLLLGGGTLTLGHTGQQTVALLLRTAPGEWKEHPLLGADAMGQLGGNADPMWAQEAKNMMRACGVDVSTVAVDEDGTITIR